MAVVRAARAVDRRRPAGRDAVRRRRPVRARARCPRRRAHRDGAGRRQPSPREPTVTVAGTTDAPIVYVRGRRARPRGIRDRRRVHRRACRSRSGANTDHRGGGGRRTAARRPCRRTVTSTNFGTRLGTVDDPAGDDNGPGDYVYPTEQRLQPGRVRPHAARRLRRRPLDTTSSRRSRARSSTHGAATRSSSSGSTSTSSTDAAGGAGRRRCPARTRTSTHPYEYVDHGGSASTTSAVRDASGATVAERHPARAAGDAADRRRRCRRTCSTGSTSRARRYAGRPDAQPRRSERRGHRPHPARSTTSPTGNRRPTSA